MEWSWKFIFIWGSILLSLRITHQAVNVALGGVANASSLLDPLYPPDLVIDGKPNTDYMQGSCFSTLREANPWWRLDMRRPYVISSITVSRRSDVSIYELQGAEIRIGNSLENNGNNNPRCAVITVTTEQVSMVFSCSQMTGRYVNIFIPGGDKAVQICEISVLTTTRIPEANVALGAVAAQSSFLEPRDTNVVIDGEPYTEYDTYKTCSSTEFQSNPWIRLDLRGLYFISVIEVVRRSDCCINEIEGTEIRIGNSLENNGNNNPRCAVVTVTRDVNTAFNCNQMQGRYVNLVIPGITKRLQLCEIKVYATTHITGESGYCYPSTSCSRDYILINEPKTWSEAQAYCRERYTDLATINNAQDMSRITDKMGNDTSDFWIGLHEGDATWRWSLLDEAYYGDDGAEFSNWGAGEPNEMSLMQSCVGIQQTGEWKDLDCDLLHYFLCFDGRDGSPKTKILVETPMKWADAQRYCRQYHTDLLNVKNLKENQEIQSMVPAGKLAWIGLYGDSWMWSDDSTSLFRNWSQNAVDGLGEGPNCGYFHNEQWSVRSCDTKSVFLCYYYKKRTLVRISTNKDMSDPNAQRQFLSQLEAEMRKKGISDFKIRWRRSFKQK